MIINIFLENGQVFKLESMSVSTSLRALYLKLRDDFKGHDYTTRGLSDTQQGSEINLKVLNRDPNSMRSNQPETLPCDVYHTSHNGEACFEKGAFGWNHCPLYTAECSYTNPDGEAPCV